MKKHAKKSPRTPAPGKRMGPAKVSLAGVPMDQDMPRSLKDSTADDAGDMRQAARKSRPSVI